MHKKHPSISAVREKCEEFSLNIWNKISNRLAEVEGGIEKRHARLIGIVTGAALEVGGKAPMNSVSNQRKERKCLLKKRKDMNVKVRGYEIEIAKLSEIQISKLIIV